MIKVENLSKIYKKGNVSTQALDNVNIQVENDEFVVILGASGSGKTTLLNLIGGLDVPTSGAIYFNGKNISDLNDKEKAKCRSHEIGFVFQQFNLNPVLTVYENIVLPVLLDDAKIDEEYVNELIAMLGLEEKKASYPKELSGGQQQRVAIARAFANKAGLILADEPTGNLDSKNGELVVNMILDLKKKYHQTVIMITHNEKIGEKADRVIRIQDGKIVE